MNHTPPPQSKHKGLVSLLISFLLLIPLSSCSSEPQTVSISATTFNYSPDDLIFVWINGKQAARGIDAAPDGKVKGGGKIFCCVSLPLNTKTAQVKVQPAANPPYTIEAPVYPQPWPEIVNYAVVHVLPNRKAAIEVVPANIEPDMSLLPKAKEPRK